jgi:hypothetical protein
MSSNNKENEAKPTFLEDNREDIIKAGILFGHFPLGYRRREYDDTSEPYKTMGELAFATGSLRQRISEIESFAYDVY